MDILLYNNKNEVVSAYTQNKNYQNGNVINIKDENKNYKVVGIEKYRKLDVSESVEQVTLELMQTS